MKKLSQWIIAAGIVLIGYAALLAQQDPPEPVTEYTVNVIPLASLSANSLRVTSQGWTLDPTNGKPRLKYLIEAWGTEVDENTGLTNWVIVQKRTFTVTTAQLNAWNASTNGFTWLKAALLSKTKMTEAVAP